MAKKKKKNPVASATRQLSAEEIYGLLGGQLARHHVGDLVWDLGGILEAAKAGDETQVMSYLESIRETLSNVSPKFERELFIPAVTQSRLRAADARQHRVDASVKNERRMRTETLQEFVARGGKPKVLKIGEAKQVNVSLDDLGL